MRVEAALAPTSGIATVFSCAKLGPLFVFFRARNISSADW